MKQISLLPKLSKSRTAARKKTRAEARKEHGGSLLLGRRRVKRPLSVKAPLHLVLKSDFAYGQRSLVRHRPLIDRILKKATKRFHVRVYEKGVVGNHIHLAVKGKTREGLQNFFRVVSGHIAQEILREFPITKRERDRRPGGAPRVGSRGGAHDERGGAPEDRRTVLREKENKFWQTRIYTRLVTWGREFIAVRAYVVRNHLEALSVIAYRDRGRDDGRAVPDR